jgi:hypothetical protein
MSLNDHPAKRKSQPHPMGFRGNERIKYVFPMLWVDPRARVLDRQDNFIVAMALASHLQHPMIVFLRPLHCFNCVADQIEEDLL